MKKSISCAAALVVISSQAQSAILIDNFSDVTGSGSTLTINVESLPTPTASSITVAQSGLTGVIGGSRSLTIERTATTGTGVRRVTGEISDLAPAFFEYTSSTGADGFALLAYGTSSDLNYNFLSESGFIIDFDGYDAPNGNPLVVTIELVSSAGSGSATANLTTNGGQVQIDFSNAGYAAVDFSDIDKINVKFDPNRGGDFEVNKITTVTAVPEPSSAALLGLGGLALILRRKK